MTLTSLPNEAELLIQLAGGDKHAFTLLFNHYQRFVYSFGKRLTHSEEMAINIVQDVFIKIWETREKLTEVDNFGGYLNRIVRNHSFNSLRGVLSKSKNTVELDEAEQEPDYNTLQQLDYNETLRLVEGAISTLSPQQRSVYELCHQQGFKYEEAAEKLGLSKQTVHVHMKLALRKIREHLKNNGAMYPLLALLLGS